MRYLILLLGIGFAVSTQAELLHHYAFDASAPFADALNGADLVEYGSEGTITMDPEGIVSFSGTITTDDTVYLESDALNESFVPFIISIWFRSSNIIGQSNYSSLFSSNAGTDAGFQIHFYNGFFGINMNGTKLEVLPLTELTPNEWHLVTVMQDPSAAHQGKIWLDGTVYDSDTGSFGDLNTFRLGVNRNGSQGFEGDLADIRIYNNEAWDSTRQINTFAAGPLGLSTYSLTISSLHGMTDPAEGVSFFNEGTVAPLSVTSPVDNGTTQYVCTGWTLTGQEPDNGTTNRFDLTLTNNATVTWNWSTNYWVETSADANGSVSASCWVTANTTTSLVPSPDAYFEFLNWSGDASGSNNPLWLLVDAPKNITANFTAYVLPDTLVDLGAAKEFLFLDVGTDPSINGWVGTGLFEGDIGWSGSNDKEIEVHGTLNGDIYHATGSSTVVPGTHHGTDYPDSDMSGTRADILAAMTKFSSFSQDTDLGAISLMDEDYTLHRTDEFTVVDLTELNMTRGTLTLAGQSNDVFYIRVENLLKLKGTDIVVTGTDPSRVFFIYSGSDDLYCRRGHIVGNFIAPYATVHLKYMKSVAGSFISGDSFLAYGLNTDSEFNHVEPAVPPPVCTLTIISSHGTAVPGVGTYSLDEGTITNLSVSASDENGTTQYACTGWTLTGQEPASGTGSSVTLTLTNNASLTWTWSTNYWVEAMAGANGSITSPGWSAAGTTIDITPDAGPYYEFAGWSGDATGTDTPLLLLIDGPKSVTATYTESLTANTGTPHWWLDQIDPNYASNFETAATANFDDDDFSNWEEYIAGLDPTEMNTRNRLNVVDSSAGRLMTWYASTNQKYSILQGLDIIGSDITNAVIEHYTPTTDGEVTYTNSTPVDDNTVYYRLVVERL